MKRFTLVLFLILPIIKYSSAQIFKAGFYAGAVASDVSGTDNIDNDNDFNHLGFTVAGTVSARISPKSILQMEIRFIQRGASQPPILDSLTGTYNNYFNMTLNYVDVVIGIKHQIHFNLKNVATDRYGIEGGVSIGSLVSYSYEVQSITYNLAVNSIDYSPYVGIYYNITPHFYVEGRYSNSINSVLVHDNVRNPYFLYYNSWNAGHNLAFSMTFGFVFGNIYQPSTNKPVDNTATDSTDK